MDDLSVALNNSGIEGYLGDAFLNHLCYADDICLISLSSDNVVRYYIVIYTYYIVCMDLKFLYAYLFSSICVIMKITLFSKLYYLVIYMNKLVIQIRNL